MKASDRRVHRPITTTKVRGGAQFSDIRKHIPTQWRFVGSLLNVGELHAIFVVSMPYQNQRVAGVFMFNKDDLKEPFSEISKGVFTNVQQARTFAQLHHYQLMAEIAKETTDDDTSGL